MAAALEAEAARFDCAVDDEGEIGGSALRGLMGARLAEAAFVGKNEDDDDGDYDNRYLYVKRFDFVSDITNSPFDTPIIDCRDLRLNVDVHPEAGEAELTPFG